MVLQPAPGHTSGHGGSCSWWSWAFTGPAVCQIHEHLQTQEYSPSLFLVLLPGNTCYSLHSGCSVLNEGSNLTSTCTCL